MYEGEKRKKNYMTELNSVVVVNFARKTRQEIEFL